MKITNIRVLNNYKVKLINAKFSGVSPFESAFNDQGTRPPDDTPTIITNPPDPEFQEKFNRVFNYLINRYEPGWSAATADLGRAATMQLLGISAAINPLILGGTVETAFNFTTNGDEGWFDPLTHPKDFASGVRSAYKKFERARSPQRASNKFVQYNLNGIFSQDFLFNGGNAFFGYHPRFDWYPGNSLPQQIHMGYSANYDNCIRRSIIHSPYGNFNGPMNSYAGNWRRFPWLSDRYTAEAFQFDMYLLMRENTTIRDLLNVDTFSGRSAEFGVIVNGVTDANLNTAYSGLCFPAGLISRVRFDDYGRTGGGYSADQVLVGSPWIRYPEAITYSGWWGLPNERAGLCFAYETLTLFNGMTFPNDPQDLRDITSRPPMTDVVGISYGYGDMLLQSLDDLSAAWGNSMEFIAYLGCLPYGTGLEMRIPFGLYRDPTVAGNKEYFKWRLDASVSHWKEKFKSPFDGFAHIFMDASAVIERTFHQWQAPGYTLWTNIASSGASYVENIPVEWARDQYNYTFGDSDPDAANGVVLGVGNFTQHMFKDDVGLLYPNRNDQRRFAGDTNPRHWCLDDDKANALFSTPNDMLLGQRKWGLTYSNSIWGMGVCGTSELGEIFAVATPDALGDTNKSAMSAFSCFYNTFIEVETDGDIKWKKVPGTVFNNGNDGVPWIHDRRFRLFYLYPTMLALNTTIVDCFHDGVGYYNHFNKSGWFDKTLGIFFEPNMESNGRGTVVSNFPYANRRTPTKPAQNFWTGIARTSEFELLYACMKGGITTGLDSLYFNELYEELKNGEIEPPDTSRTGFFRALDFAVWAASWTPAATGPDGQSLYPSIVPMLHVDNTPGVDLNYFRYRDGPGSTAGMTFTSDTYSDIFGAHKRLAAQIPYERRMLKPQYWLLDGPPGFHREPHYYFKKLTDGTTYTGSAGGLTFLSTEFGGTWGAFTDTNPIRFLTPWAYENRSVAKQSFLNFLSQAKNDGMLFKYLHDDSEAWGDQFSVAGPYLSRTDLGTTAALLNWANDPNNNFKVIPDARQTYAIVNDARFNGITSSITNRTFAQEFKYRYDGLTYMDPNGFAGSCGANAEELLSYFTNVASRQDFKNAYQSDETRQTAFAWGTALYVFTQGDLKSKIIGDSLRETPGFENTIVTSSEVHEMTSAEARYGVDPGGLSRVAIKLPGYGHSHHLYAEMADYLTRDYGYPPSALTDESIRFGKRFGFHPVSEGGITFGNRAYQGLIHNQKKVRAILRSRPQAPSEGLNFLIIAGPHNLFNNSVGFTGPLSEEYFKEDIFHSCLSGTNQFIVFNTRDPAGKDLSRVNSALVEWREISGNKVAVPCDSTGSTSGLVDRIDLHQAGINCVISGAMTTDPNERLWRITVPPNKNSLIKTSTTQPTLPDIISIPSGSRGVWIKAPASYGKPGYISEQAYYYENEHEKRMYAQILIGVNGATEDIASIWNSINGTFIPIFKGTPMVGTRAYPFEVNPANPSVSSPWHNVIYEMCIDPYKWGCRAMYIYMPWGSFDTAFYLTPEIWKRTFTDLTEGNSYTIPARWKGFTSAVKALLEGKLAPSGKSAMNEPCNVMLYHGSNNGHPPYRRKSTALWDSFTGTTAQKDEQYYEYLDSWTDTLISIKSDDPTKGKLHITLDATSPSADESTLPLYRSLGTGDRGYRSDALELADWYVFNRLKAAGISVYYEARSVKSKNRAVLDIGVAGNTGATLAVKWAREASHFEEYWLWYSNPSNADINFDNFQTDDEHRGMVRLIGSNFPIIEGGDPNRDPFKTKLNIELSDGRGATIDYFNTASTFYTPHYNLWQIYALSDNYRKYYNKSVNSPYFSGVKLNTEHLIAYNFERIANSDVCLATNNGQVNPLDRYWRLNSSIADSFRPKFDLDKFNQSSNGGGGGAIYGSPGNGGFWTEEGLEYYDNEVKQTSFANFIDFLHAYSETTAPPNTPGWTGPVYGTTMDVLVKNVIPIIQVI